MIGFAVVVTVAGLLAVAVVDGVIWAGVWSVRHVSR